MFGNMLNGLFDKEQMTYDTVQSALENVSEELGGASFFIMIRPMDSEFNHKYFICKYDEKGNPVKVREITLKEILSEPE